MDYTRNGGGSSGAEQSSRKSDHIHRHTPQQIQRLERIFNEVTHHPDEKARVQLGRELGMSRQQVKFWFQNRRTQLKTKQGKEEIVALRAENEVIRHEIDALTDALGNMVCESCGGPCQVDEDNYIKQQKLREENARLKEEIKWLSNEAEKYTSVSQLNQGSSGMPVSQLNQGSPGMPVSQLNQGNPGIPVSQLDQGSPGMHVSQLNQGNPLNLSSLPSFGHQGMTTGSSYDLLFPGSSPAIQMLPFGYIITDLDKSLMVDIARNAMKELTSLFQSHATFWIDLSDGRTVLNLEAYGRTFPRPMNKLNVRTESSKTSRIVYMNSLALVDFFMDANMWMEAFPTIVLKAGTIEVILAGPMGSRNGRLQLMYEEIQVLSPLIQTRKLYFLRFFQRIEQHLWAIVDVSYDIPQELSDAEWRVRRLPSGCYIQDLLNGHSKITWMEHMQVEHKRTVHNFYRDCIYSGSAFGAERRLDTLQRMCERLTSQMMSSTFSNHGGVNPSPRGRRNLMKLSQRMVSSFCASINPVDGQQRMISEMNDFKVHTTFKNGFLSGTATIWLPFSPQQIFDFLGNENMRLEWDVIPDYTSVQEVGRIACGSHPWNYISIIKASTTSQSNEWILQESCIESSTALIVYCPLHLQLPDINRAISGEGPSLISLFPSGFTISPSENISGEMSGGSLLTVLQQIFEPNSTSADTINHSVAVTIDRIKAALN